MLLGRYLFQSVFIDQAILSEFKGVDFRGAFRPALKKVVCALKQLDCSGCSLSRRCLYPLVFGGAEHKDRRAPDGPVTSARSVRGCREAPDDRGATDRSARAQTGGDVPASPRHEPPDSARSASSRRPLPRTALFGKANERSYFVQASSRWDGWAEFGRAAGRLPQIRHRTGPVRGEGQPILDEAATVI